MKLIMTNTRLNFIDVFSGAGGMSCGLEQAGLRCLLGVDKDKYAMETFRANHKYAETFVGDIKELKGKTLHQLINGQTIHAVVGGPPCQGFSTVGRGNPKDSRNSLFMEFVRIVKELSPNFIIVENVTGLLAEKNEKTLKSIFKKFHALGYELDVKVLSAQNYGVAEKRRRTIIIGSKINSVIEFPKITHDVTIKNKYRPSVNIGEIFKDLADKKGDLHNHDLAAASIKCPIEKKRIKKVPEGRGIRYEKDELAFLPPKLRLGVDWASIRENRFRQTKYQRLNRELPSPTIMTHRHNYYHPVEDRFLTQREAAKIQSFPNNFIFKGPVSAQWRQIGNAVPPLLGKALGKAIKKMYNEFLLLEENPTNEAKSKKPHRKKPSNVKTEHLIHTVRKKAFVYKEKSKESKS